MSFNKMKKLWNNIKEFGTNMKSLQGINSVFIEQARQQKLKQQKEEEQKTDKNKMLNENGLFLKLWNVLLILLYIYTGHVSTIKVCFFDGREQTGSYVFEKIVDFLILIDIIIKFFTPIKINRNHYLYN